MSLSPPRTRTAPSSATGPESHVFKDNYTMDGIRRTSTNSEAKSYASEELHGNKLSRTMSVPSYSENSTDPRLDEYINFYKQKNLKRNSSLSRKSSVDYSCYYENPKKGSSVSKSTIPSHPKESPIPSALLNGYDHVSYNKNISASATSNSSLHHLSLPPTGSSKFSFLRRKSVSADTPPQSMESLRSTSPTNSSVQNSELSSLNILPELAKVKPLKRVAFHALTFLMDPPQQIPSRKPRKGNVDVLANGQLKINPLTEEEKLAMEKSLMGQGGGIVVGGTGALSMSKKAEEEKVGHVSETEADEADGDEDDEIVDKHAKLLGIEKPFISHRSQESSYVVPVKKMALDLMYTRICHLREILPIPAILKQIIPGSLAPIPLLQLRNPTPTLVEIQTFADFVRIAPIVCISLDGVSLTFEQFKIILSAMSAKKQLEKLSLRNTPINHEGWSLLCWFLSRNTVLNKLDITQCPSLSINLLKKKKKKPTDKPNPHEHSDASRMTCNNENRSDMDWELFTATLIARGGIDELILTGCCIMDTVVFENLVKLAMLIRTTRLGLAYNKLSTTQLKLIVDNWISKPFARGLDLGYNDFSSLQYLNIILKQRRDPNFEENLKKSTLGFLSLNATNLRFSESFKEVLETILMRYPNLKYLDLSNNPKLFGQPTPTATQTASTIGREKEIEEISVDSLSMSLNSSASSTIPDISQGLTQDAIVSYFTSKLPLFPKLIRLHLENNCLSGNSIISIAKTLPFCKNLGYFSVHGNELDLTAAAALLQGVENSKTLITLDCDYESLPILFKEKIGLYTMRNMERILYASKRNNMPSDEANDAGVVSNSTESATLTEQLNSILSRKANDKLNLEDPEVQGFIGRARKIRGDLRSSMNELYKLQLKNELTVEGKEMLIRFVFIESSIERGLQLIDPSLADPKDSYSSSECFRHSAEDERKSQITFSKVDGNDIKTQSATPPLMSRTSSKSNLSALDKNEGSVLKLRKLHDNLRDQEPDSEKGQQLFDDFDKLSGEEIRKTLLNADLTDLDKVITYLGDLKEHKISLESVFQLNDQLKGANSSDESIQMKLGRLKKTLTQLAENRSGLEGSPVSASGSESNESSKSSNDSKKQELANGDTAIPTTPSSDKVGDSTVTKRAPVESVNSKTGSNDNNKSSDVDRANNNNSVSSTSDPDTLRATYDHLLNDLERRINT